MVNKEIHFVFFLKDNILYQMRCFTLTGERESLGKRKNKSLSMYSLTHPHTHIPRHHRFKDTMTHNPSITVDSKDVGCSQVPQLYRLTPGELLRFLITFWKSLWLYNINSYFSFCLSSNPSFLHTPELLGPLHRYQPCWAWMPGWLAALFHLTCGAGDSLCGLCSPISPFSQLRFQWV